MRKVSRYNGEVIVDTTNSLVEALRSRKVLDVAVSEHKGYPHGMAQPAVLVEGNQVGVLYKWAIIPGLVSTSSHNIWWALGTASDHVHR